MTTTAMYPLSSEGAIDVAAVTECQPQEIEQITDHVAQGLSHLIEQYKGKPRIEAFLTSFLEQTQELEDAIFQLIDSNLSNATGDMLRKFGKIVGQTNPGLNDNNYRVLIRARIAVNRSNGYPDELINILKLVALSTGETPANITFREGHQGYVLYLTSDVGDIDPDIIWGLLDEADAAGVPGRLVYGHSPTAELFRWSSSRGTVTYDGQGFSSSNTAGQGGKLSSARGSTT
jgi:hypothetical protein